MSLSSVNDRKRLSELYESTLVEMDVSSVMGGDVETLSLENEDDYAPDDNRVPYLMGRIQSRTVSVKKNKKKKTSRKVGTKSAS